MGPNKQSFLIGELLDSIASKLLPVEASLAEKSQNYLTFGDRSDDEATITNSHSIYSSTRQNDRHRRGSSAPSKLGHHSRSPPLEIPSRESSNNVQNWVDRSTKIPPPTNELSPPSNNRMKEKPMKGSPIIVSNISKSRTQSEIIEKIRAQFGNVEMLKVEFLNSGDIKLAPKDPKDINTLLSKEKWDHNFFGENICIFQADRSPWYCIDRVPNTIDIGRVKIAIENFKTRTGERIFVNDIHRKTKGLVPSSLIVFKLLDPHSGRYITNRSISLDGILYTVRKFIESEVTRCISCNTLGHTWDVNNKQCIRCTESDWEVKDCQTAKLRQHNPKDIVYQNKRHSQIGPKPINSTITKPAPIHSINAEVMEKMNSLSQKVEDLTLKNHLLTKRLSEMELSQKSSINAEQLNLILNRVFLHLIPNTDKQIVNEMNKTISRDIKRVCGDKTVQKQNTSTHDHNSSQSKQSDNILLRRSSSRQKSRSDASSMTSSSHSSSQRSNSVGSQRRKRSESFHHSTRNSMSQV